MILFVYLEKNLCIVCWDCSRISDIAVLLLLLKARTTVPSTQLKSLLKASHWRVIIKVNQRDKRSLVSILCSRGFSMTQERVVKIIKG